MRVKELRNTSDQSVQLEESNGCKIIVPPGGSVQNKNLMNLAEVKSQVTVVYDLGEVNESCGKTRLFD